MWKGLHAMSIGELGLGARLAGLKVDPATADSKELLQKLLDWMGSTLGCPDRQPAELERATILWLAQAAGVEPLPGEPLEDLENRVWEYFSEDAARRLMPVWRVGSCMAALGPPEALADERELLDRVAVRLLPSEKARAAMRSNWEALCSKPARHHSEVLERLAPDLAALSTQPDLVKPTLVLALVVALADSSFELEEARLYDKIAAGLGLEPGTAARIKEKVSHLFWDARDRLVPRRRGEEPEFSHELSLRAAHESLEAAGILEELREEISSEFLAGLHHGLLHDRDFQRGLKAWRKTPLHWPVGLAVGLSLYLRGRVHAEEERKLLLFLYLVHLREGRGPEN